MTLKNQFKKVWEEFANDWDRSFYLAVLTIDWQISSVTEMIDLMHANEELWPENDSRLPYLGSHKDAIWDNLDELNLKKEIVKSSYIYIYSKLDGLLESIFAGKISISCGNAYKYLKTGFKEWNYKYNESSGNVARYKYLFFMNQQNIDFFKELTELIEKTALELITENHEEQGDMPLNLEPPKRIDLMRDLKKFNGKNRGLRNKIVHARIETGEDISITDFELIEVIGQCQRISTCALLQLLIIDSTPDLKF
jgi:hypothetical protein|tara:strand:- start:43 stop:801 length:759 start_codon:yes stop_codon:yes gene_type:complete